MRKVNKMLMATVSILLCLVLISTSVVSGIYAKFVITKSGDATVSLKAFGLTLTVKCGESKSGGTIEPIKIGDNTISVKVDNVKMISPQISDNKYYDELIKFELGGQSNVSKVKLKLTVDFSGVDNFKIPANTVIDSNYTIETGGNYLPFAFWANFSGGNIALDYWRKPESDDALEVSFINSIKTYNGVKDRLLEDDELNDNKFEFLLCDAENQKTISTISFGYRMYMDNSKTSYTKEGDHPKDGSEAHAMQTYFANKATPPTFSATYTVSIEQVID